MLALKGLLCRQGHCRFSEPMLVLAAVREDKSSINVTESIYTQGGRERKYTRPYHALARIYRC